jgi:hypothetical protein
MAGADQGRVFSFEPEGFSWHYVTRAAASRQPWSCLRFKKRFGGYVVIRKLKTGQYRLYSRKKDPRTGKARNLGTFGTRAAAEKHERAVQFFKRH